MCEWDILQARRVAFSHPGARFRQYVVAVPWLIRRIVIYNTHVGIEQEGALQTATGGGRASRENWGGREWEWSISTVRRSELKFRIHRCTRAAASNYPAYALARIYTQNIYTCIKLLVAQCMVDEWLSAGPARVSEPS